MSDGTSGPPTKTITDPDGHPINYPYLPNVGEPFQKPEAVSHSAAKEQQAEPAAISPPATNESFRERLMSAARSAVERAGVYGHAAVQALVLDDWKALTDAHSSLAQRVEGGVDLASWAIPEGKIAEIAGHAAVKAAELAAAHLTASGVEHASASAAAIAAVRLSRPLTEAERSGHFESANDFKRFMGPATEPGGPERDWHHVVEKIHADATNQFPPRRVHSIENIVPVPRDIHQGAGGLTSEFSAIDRRVGTSLRDRLNGQPWEKHVDNGEQALRDRGLDPDALRAETHDRFQQRLLEHDRGASIEHDRAQILAPGLLQGANQATNREMPATQRESGVTQWSPEMSHEDFAKLQARVRGGLPAGVAETGLHLERNGRQESLPPGRGFEGRIRAVDGDQIVQHIGRNITISWSREELAGHFSDPKAFDAMVQPGHYLQIGADRNGVVDVRQQFQDHSWQSLGNQPIPHQSIGHELGR